MKTMQNVKQNNQFLQLQYVNRISRIVGFAKGRPVFAQVHLIICLWSFVWEKLQGRNIKGQSYKTFIIIQSDYESLGSVHMVIFSMWHHNRSGINSAGVNIWWGLFIDEISQKNIPHDDEVNPIAIIGRTSKRSLRLQY